MKVISLCCILLFIVKPIAAQTVKLTLIDSNEIKNYSGVAFSQMSFRGVSVVNDSVFWISGRKGCIANTVNGEKNIEIHRVTGYEQLDFRDIHAWSSQSAIAMSSGFPAVVIRTTDGGKHWKTVVNKPDSAYFFDAIDFLNPKQGILVGDPVDGYFTIMLTIDSGNTWKNISTSLKISALPGEAAFAASGTCVKWINKKSFFLVTGGLASRAIHVNIKTGKQLVLTLPFASSYSSGAFSIALTPRKGEAIISGGDYVNDTSTLNDDVFTIRYNKKHCWVAQPSTKGFYKSAVAAFGTDFLKQPMIVCTGTAATQVLGMRSSFIGPVFIPIATYFKGFNTIGKSPQSSVCILAGNKGRMAILKL